MVLILGIVLTAANAAWMTYMEIVWNQGYATLLSLYYSAVFSMILVLLINSLICRILPKLALTRFEMLTLFIMTTIGTSIAMQTEYMMSILAFPRQYSAIDSRWNTSLIPHLPKLLTVSDPQAVKDYYLGNAALQWSSIKAWLLPLTGWGIFIMAMMWTGICLSVLFYDHWRNQERLPFPINQIPLAVTEPRTRFYRSWLFWIAFGLTAAINIVNALHSFFPEVPLLQVKRMVITIDGLPRPWSALSPVAYSLNPILVGLEYFLPVDLLFSIFFFYWTGRLQGVVFSAFGVEGSGQAEMVAPYIREQAFGALIALIIFSFWAARGTWRESWDRTGGFMPRKTAVYGAAGGIAVMTGILIIAGMSLHIAILFVGILVTLAVSLTRIRGQYGPPSAGLLLGAPGPVIYNLFGRDGLGTQGLMSLSVTHWAGREMAGHPMLPTMEGMALTEKRMKASTLIICMLAAAFAGYIAASGTALITGYTLGQSTAKTAGTQIYFGNEAYQRFSMGLSDRTSGIHPANSIAMAAGAIITLVLQALRTRFVGFALHPVGYAIASTYISTFVWSTALITWVFKLLLLRYSGLKGYYAAAPFFLGLLLGDCVTGSLISLIGVATGQNLYVFWPY